MLVDPKVFVFLHVLVSLAGIFSGLVAVGGLVAGAQLRRWLGAFFVTNLLTDLTGFGFPFNGIQPSHVFGVLSILATLGAMFALYFKELTGRWRVTFVLLSITALYLNVFVLLAQLFQKVPAMAMLAPTPAAPIFGATVAVAFVLLAGMARSSLKSLRVQNNANRALPE